MNAVHFKCFKMVAVNAEICNCGKVTQVLFIFDLSQFTIVKIYWPFITFLYLCSLKLFFPKSMHSLLVTAICSNLLRLMNLLVFFFVLSLPDCHSTWYSTLNKGRFPSYFWITTPGRVIRRSFLEDDSSRMREKH